MLPGLFKVKHVQVQNKELRGFFVNLTHPCLQQRHYLIHDNAYDAYNAYALEISRSSTHAVCFFMRVRGSAALLGHICF